jgi:ribosomal protein L30E
VPEYKYTQVAARAVSLAELFEARFERGLEGPVHFKVELSAPDGPSTAGGKQALQHIKLVPQGGGSTVVIGSAHPTRMTAEIRTYEHVADLYAQRFRGAKLPVDVTRYYELGQALATFFRAMKMSVTFSEVGGVALAAPPPPRQGGRGWLLALGLLAALSVLAAAYVLVFLRR